jgi:hypothetical protein
MQSVKITGTYQCGHEWATVLVRGGSKREIEAEREKFSRMVCPRCESLRYQTWLHTLLAACNASPPVPSTPWSLADFQAVNIEWLYSAGFTPENAATICKVVNQVTAAITRGR